MSLEPALSRTEAEMRVAAAYEHALGRNPFTAVPYDAGAYDWVLGMMYHGETSISVEYRLRESDEARARAEQIVRNLYRKLLGRDPGPPSDDAPWADPGALGYVESVRQGLTEEQLEAVLKASEEYQSRRRDQASRPEVVDNVIHDTATGRKELELGVSLFYALSPDTSRDSFERVVDELAAAGIRQVRLAGSTFTWDNPLRKANVVPFRTGRTYTHTVPQSVDLGRAVDPVFDEDHAAELSLRLNMLASRGIRAQYTIFWGGMQPLFTIGDDGKSGHPPGEGGRTIIWDRVASYLEDVARVLSQHPEHLIEIINECDHGHHLGKVGYLGRLDFLARCARIIRSFHPRAMISASDGGHQPRVDGSSDAPEGYPYFDYHGVRELSYWNVHFPRDSITAEGIPRWCRGSWHLYGDRGAFREAHGGLGGYGRSDENIFLQTKAEADKWGYRASTLDWEMYGTMLWITTMAGAGLTLHTHKGFFCEPGLTSDEIFRVVRAFVGVTKDFPWHGATSYNTGWSGSPVKSYERSFKAFSLVSGENGRDVLVTVLNPNEGRLTLAMDRPRLAKVYELTGELLDTREIPAGESVLPLPWTAYEHALVLRLYG